LQKQYIEEKRGIAYQTPYEKLEKVTKLLSYYINLTYKERDLKI